MPNLRFTKTPASLQNVRSFPILYLTKKIGVVLCHPTPNHLRTKICYVADKSTNLF